MTAIASITPTCANVGKHMPDLDFSAFTQSLKASKVSETVTISRREYDTIQERLAILQEVANRCAEMDLDVIHSCVSLQQAQKLIDTYNSAWFRDAPYSDEKLRQIAEALLEACSTFFPDNQVWIRATQGIYPMADLFYGSPYPDIKVPQVTSLSGKLKEGSDDKQSQEESGIKVPQIAHN
jgi:hypothetical protein